MSEVNVLKRIVDPLVELLAHKNLKVSFRGGDAMTQYDKRTGKPKKIILPMISSDADPSLIDTFHGYIDHEVGHVIFTDFQEGNLAKKLKNPILTTVFNMVEDPRVENAIQKRFKGSAHNLEKLHERIFNDDYVLRIPNDPKDPNYIFSSLIFAIRACCGQRYFKRMIDVNPKLLPVYELVKKHYAKELLAMKSSEDAYKVAKKIFDAFADKKSAMEMMMEVVEIVEEVFKGSKKESGSDKSSSAKAMVKAKELKEEGEGLEKDSGESEEKSEGKDSKEGTGGKEDKKEGESKSGSGKKKESRSKSEKKEDTSKDASEEKASGGEAETPKEDGEMTDGESGSSKWIKPEDCEDMYDGEILRKMKISSKERSPSGYTILTTDNDEVAYIEEAKSDDPIRQMEESTRQMVGTIQKNLERAMAAKSISRWHTGFRRGKLNSSSLSRLFFNDDRVFRKKELGISRDVAITLLVDCSGSMIGKKAHLAATSAFALAGVLQNMNITCELIGFTTKGAKPRCGDYSRVAPIYMPIFKSFNDRWDIRSKRRLAMTWYGDWMDNNVDGECVQIAANRLLARPEAGKIMIVLSDGWPCADGSDGDLREHLKETVLDIEKKIKVVGIGIKSDAVEEYYKKHVVLDDIRELPGTVIKRVQELLLS